MLFIYQVIDEIINNLAVIPDFTYQISKGVLF